MRTASGREILELTTAVKRVRRVPAGLTCSVCGMPTQLSLRADGQVRCYAHLRSDNAGTELDHWVGRAVVDHAVIRLHANAHRQVTELRRLMGIGDLPAVAGDPLLLLAHLTAAMASLLMLFAAWLADYVVAIRSQLPIPPFPVVA